MCVAGCPGISGIRSKGSERAVGVPLRLPHSSKTPLCAVHRPTLLPAPLPPEGLAQSAELLIRSALQEDVAGGAFTVDEPEGGADGEGRSL